MHVHGLPNELLLATTNAGKRRELAPMLAPLGIGLIDLHTVAQRLRQDPPQVAETGTTFRENALLKAHAFADWSSMAVIAEDSGLEVDVLDGRPGIYSARFSGPKADDAANNTKLLALLQGVSPARRSARYRCAAVYLDPSEHGTPIVAEGRWEGRIAEQPAGVEGFGYDPLFFVPEEGRTAAQLPAEQKNRLSHRHRAMSALLARLRQGSLSG